MAKILTDDEKWEAVMKLEGKIMKTVSRGEINTIITVENNNLPDDKVIIKERTSSPTRNEIVETCHLLYKKRQLTRKDLESLKLKRVSSIVFTIVKQVTGASLIKPRPATIGI